MGGGHCVCSLNQIVSQRQFIEVPIMVSGALICLSVAPEDITYIQVPSNSHLSDTTNTGALLKPIIQQALVFHRWWERELLTWSPATRWHCKEEPDMLLVIISATLFLITCGCGIFLLFFFSISLPLFLQKLFFPMMWVSSLQDTSSTCHPHHHWGIFVSFHLHC